MSALSKITALRSFSDLPFSFLTVASQIARSSSVSRTIYFFAHGNLLVTAEVLQNRRSWQPQDLDSTGH